MRLGFTRLTTGASMGSSEKKLAIATLSRRRNQEVATRLASALLGAERKKEKSRAGGGGTSMLRLLTSTQALPVVGSPRTTPKHYLYESQRPEATHEPLPQSITRILRQAKTDDAMSKSDPWTMKQISTWSNKCAKQILRPTRQPKKSNNWASRPKVCQTPSQTGDKSRTAVRTANFVKATVRMGDRNPLFKAGLL